MYNELSTAEVIPSNFSRDGVHAYAYYAGMDVPSNVQKVLDHFGWSKTEMARQAGIRRQAVNGWFNEGKTPSDAVCNTLKRKYGINPDFMQGQSDVMLLALDNQIIDALERLNAEQPEDMPAILKMLRGFLAESS